jgi:hypothetical protein
MPVRLKKVALTADMFLVKMPDSGMVPVSPDMAVVLVSTYSALAMYAEFENKRELTIASLDVRDSTNKSLKLNSVAIM